MFRLVAVALAVTLIAGPVLPFASAQVRVTPKSAPGGVPLGEPWADVPEPFRHLPIPEWPVPTDLQRWQRADRAQTRATVLRLLGQRPARPDPAKVKVLSREEHEDYTLERFEFFNGVDMDVPGILFLPKHRSGPAPAVIALHGHGTTKEDWCSKPKGPYLGPKLARLGYVVAAIDGYWTGPRRGKGPAGKRETDHFQQEDSLFKLNLWLGRTLWGMVVRDDQCLVDFLETRPEVDRRKIAAVGGSMGCTRAYWLAAIDDRVQVVIGDGCFTRYTELIAHGNLRYHAIYYYVPGILAHFDAEAIYALVAPRPMLMLTGDQDPHAPADGVAVLEKKVGAVYRLYGQPNHFRSVLYRKTGHAHIPEMDQELIAWLRRFAPTAK